MEQMRRKGIGSHRFANELIALIKDQTFSEVGRDYAAQHLSFWITPSVNEAPSETSEKIIKKAIQTIADTITDPSLTDTSLPGTSLMLLVQVGEKLPPKIMTPLWAKLDPALTSILKGQVYAPLATKVSIIQSVAIRHSAQHLSLIQSMARNEEIDPSIRLSSIAALGFYQSQDDYNYIAQLANGTSPFRFAAQSALKKISNKH